MSSDSKKLKILLVEDSEMVMKVHKGMFNELGYAPDTAEDGEIALELATNNEFDVIFMDIGLPKMRGTEVVAKIRQHELETRKKQAYITALTTSAHIESVQKECELAGVDSIKGKPIDTQELMQFLSRF